MSKPAANAATTVAATAAKKSRKPSAEAAAAAAGDKKKRAPSSYINFCKEMRAKVKEENPTASFGELGSILGKMWSGLSESAKAGYGQKGGSTETAAAAAPAAEGA